jgi:anti-anti-sigma regulatory factor
MASNFKIIHHQNGNNLHIKLAGDFDGSSALELIETLNKYHGKVKKVIIQTGSLAAIHPFGLQVFQNNCKMNNLPGLLTFTGKHRSEMALDERQYPASFARG